MLVKQLYKDWLFLAHKNASEITNIQMHSCVESFESRIQSKFSFVDVFFFCLFNKKARFYTSFHFDISARVVNKGADNILICFFNSLWKCMKWLNCATSLHWLYLQTRNCCASAWKLSDVSWNWKSFYKNDNCESVFHFEFQCTLILYKNTCAKFLHSCIVPRSQFSDCR